MAPSSSMKMLDDQPAFEAGGSMIELHPGRQPHPIRIWTGLALTGSALASAIPAAATFASAIPAPAIPSAATFAPGVPSAA